MKKVLYIIFCVFLGILLSFIVHALIEIPIINLLVGDFETYSYGLTWNQLYIVHVVFTAIFLVLGIIFGIWLGFHWWDYIYVKKKRGKRFFQFE